MHVLVVAAHGSNANLTGGSVSGIHDGVDLDAVTHTVLHYLENKPLPVVLTSFSNSGSSELEYTVLQTGLKTTDGTIGTMSNDFSTRDSSQRSHYDLMDHSQVRCLIDSMHVRRC